MNISVPRSVLEQLRSSFPGSSHLLSPFLGELCVPCPVREHFPPPTPYEKHARDPNPWKYSAYRRAHTILTDERLVYLSGRIGVEYATFAIHLGISYPVIKMMEGQYARNMRPLTFHILMHWRNSVELKTIEDEIALQGSLKYALTQVKRTDLVNLISNWNPPGGRSWPESSPKENNCSKFRPC